MIEYLIINDPLILWNYLRENHWSNHEGWSGIRTISKASSQRGHYCPIVEKAIMSSIHNKTQINVVKPRSIQQSRRSLDRPSSLLVTFNGSHFVLRFYSLFLRVFLLWVCMLDLFRFNIWEVFLSLLFSFSFFLSLNSISLGGQTRRLQQIFQTSAESSRLGCMNSLFGFFFVCVCVF